MAFRRGDIGKYVVTCDVLHNGRSKIILNQKKYVRAESGSIIIVAGVKGTTPIIE